MKTKVSTLGTLVVISAAAAEVPMYLPLKARCAGRVCFLRLNSGFRSLELKG